MNLREELEALKTDDVLTNEEATAHNERVRAKLEAIREKIRNGATTGDRLHDFALVHHGDGLHGDVCKIFRDLEAQLAGKTGQLFVIAEYERDFHEMLDDDRGGCFHAPYRREPHPNSLSVGFLADDKLAIDMATGTWRIPCREFAYGEVHGRGSRREGPAFFGAEESRWSYLLAKFGRPMESQPAAEIEAGDSDVVAWFGKRIHRFTKAEEIIRAHLTTFTLALGVHADHFIYGERMRLRERSFRKALELEQAIVDLRGHIEDPASRLPKDKLAQVVDDLRSSVRELGGHVEIACLLGIDPMRSEIQRINTHFGRFWKPKQ